MPISLGELAQRFDCELIGDPDVRIETLGTLANAGSNALSFLASSSYKKQLSSTKAAAVVLTAADALEAPTGALINDNPYACYARMAAVVCPPPAYAPGIHVSAAVAESATVAASAHVAANAVVEEKAVIGANTYVGPGAVVGPGCVIGADCRILANATLVRAVSTGDRCIFHSGSVIGADGFGNAMTPEGWVKVPQVGGVRIGNDVEIGSSTTVDCGAIDDTVIDDGVRLDNQIQIGHNVHVGEHTAMATGVAIAGSARIGKRCMLAGMAGIAGHIEICDDVTVLGKAMVSKSITQPGAYASMFPVEDVRSWNRRVASFRRLDKLLGRVSKLEKKEQMTSYTFPLDAEMIKELLPHREPFLMIDEVTDCVPHESVTAIKNVSADEPHFAGHFPGNPVLPGVLIIEAMAQAGGVLSHISNGDLEPKPLYMLARVEDARFRRPVVPGEQLVIRVGADKVKRGMWWYRCEASVSDQVVASATIICAPGGG